MFELMSNDGYTLQVNEMEFWRNDSLFKEIEKVGFSNCDWNSVPDDVLVYLFLHDQQTLGEKRAESTTKEYLRDLQQFLKFSYEVIGVGSVQALRAEQVLQYQRTLEERYKLTTIKRKSSVIKHFFRYLSNKEILSKDLSIQLKRPKERKADLVDRTLLDSEVKQLLSYFKDTDWFAYTLLYILVSTGMRINELATAQWNKVEYDNSSGYYFLTVFGKGNKEREVLIFQSVMEVVLENRRRKSLSEKIGIADGTAFFPKSDGSHYHSTYLSNEFTRLISDTPFEFIKNRFEKEKIPDNKGHFKRYRITPHTCRHYTASFYMENGIDSKAIQDMLGHGSLMTTERYLRKARNRKEHAGVKLGEELFHSKVT